VSPLLPGADNQKKVPDLIKDLKKWKEKKKVPTFEEFVKLFGMVISAVVRRRRTCRYVVFVVVEVAAKTSILWPSSSIIAFSAKNRPDSGLEVLACDYT